MKAWFHTTFSAVIRIGKRRNVEWDFADFGDGCTGNPAIDSPKRDRYS